MGPDRNAQLDDFSLFLPFAYRVAVLLVAGMFGFPPGGGCVLVLIACVVSRLLGLGFESSVPPQSEYRGSFLLSIESVWFRIGN